MVPQGIGKLVSSVTLFVAFTAAASSLPLPATQDLRYLTNQPRLVRNLFPSFNSDIGSLTGRGFVFGDFNGDGVDDLVEGGPGVTVGIPTSMANAGDVTIFHGSSYPPGSFIFTFANRPSTDWSSPWETRFLGGSAGAQAGHGVAAIDINNDGYDDVLAGAPGGTGAVAFSGLAFILYGGPSMMGASIPLFNPTNAPVFGETRILGASGSENFGWSVAGGDFNGDGFGDIAVGAPDADTASGLDAGKVFILWGSATLPNQSIDLTSVADAITPAGETRILGDDPDDHLGWALAAGDVNGDGIDDLAIGAPGGDPGGTRSNAGEAYVVYGSPTLPASTVNFATANDAVGPAGETRILADDTGDEFGRSLDLADIDGDGRADLLVGAWHADTGATLDAGEAILLRGAASLPGTVIDLNSDGAISAANEIRFTGVAATDEAGHSVALGDVDSDGKADVILAARGADHSGRTDAGRVVAISSNNLTPATTVPISPASAFTSILGSVNGAALGNGLCAGGDLNGDGFGDFAGAETWSASTQFTPIGFIATGWGNSTTPTASRFNPVGDGAGLDVVTPVDFGPVVRAIVDYGDADTADNGSGGASLTTVILNRDKSLITPTGMGTIDQVASAWWTMTTDRTGWAGGNITVEYLRKEVVGLDEASLQLYSSASPSGPWELVAGQSHDPVRRTISAPLAPFTGTRHFALSTPIAEIIVDGTLDIAYGPPISVQTVNTSFGDNSTGTFMTSGSELDALYVTNDETNLYVFLAGNLESNGNIVGIMIDNVSNPSGLPSPIPTFHYAWDTWFAGNRLDEGVLSDGFNPEYFFGMKFFDTFSNGLADWTYHESNLVQRTELAAPDMPTTISANPLIAAHADIAIAIDNSNSGGVANGSSAGFPFRGTDPALVQTGMEFAIPLSRLGQINAGDEIRFVALIGNYVLDFNSNQFLPPFPVPGSHAGAYPNNFNLPALGVTYASAFLKSPAATESGLDVVMTSTENSPTYQTNVPVTVRFRRPVTGFVESMITPVNATVQNFTAIDGSTYTFHLVPMTIEGDISATIAGGLVQDTGLMFNRPSPPFLRHIVPVPPLPSGWSVH